MAEPLSFNVLSDAVRGNAAAFRCRTRLQPAGGEGDKVFPPTYAGAVYAVEQRRTKIGNGENGEPRFETRTCVLLDSVQSQANRMEEALQDAIDAGRISIPVIEVDFNPFFPGQDVAEDLRLLDPIGRVTSLQAPHRIADAILRDSLFDNEPFRQSTRGTQIDLASVRNATPLYTICPTSLVFGMWDSTGPKGGLGAKFERLIVAEIVGIGSPYRFVRDEPDRPKNRGIRRDPLDVRAAARVRRTSRTTWEVSNDANDRGTSSPAEINHGNVPFETDNGGVTIDYGEQTVTLSLAGLRRLKFPVNGQPWEANEAQRNRDAAARIVLAALGLCAAELAAEAGMALRSRCLLWPESERHWELLDNPGKTPDSFSLDGATAIELLEEAVQAAESVGVHWDTDPIQLRPSDGLVRLIRRSQEIAEEQGSEEEGGQ